MKNWRDVPEAARARFWSKVNVGGPNGCWLWTANRNKARHGYGQFDYAIDGRQVTWRAHRLAYCLVRGDIPEGMGLDHLCNNPPCVNPAHLEPTAHRDNVLRGTAPPGMNARKTHCPRGHSFAEHGKEYPGAGRRCGTCDYLRSAKGRNRVRVFAMDGSYLGYAYVMDAA